VGRIGTNEITRIGIKEKDIDELVSLFISSIYANVRKEVIKFRAKFKIRYC
jgi:glycine/serine hydroxymethyltransferase